MSLYEIENDDNPNICTVAINPKRYFEKFKDININKKHKGVKRDTKGMNFESYATRITPLRSIDAEKKTKKLVQKRFQVKNTNIIMTTVNKVQFASLNDKRYYFSDGIVSLPYGHALLEEVRQYKKSLPETHTVIEKEKDKLLQPENDAVNRNERLRTLKCISSQPITYYKLDSNKRLPSTKTNYTTTRDYILNSFWL